MDKPVVAIRRLAARTNGYSGGTVSVDSDDVRAVLAYIAYLEDSPVHLGSNNDQRGANIVFSGNIAGRKRDINQ